MDCPFCHRLIVGDLLAENDLAAAFLDAYPVSPGHCLVVPRRHEPDFLRLSPEEQAAVWALGVSLRPQSDIDRTPDGYNIGINRCGCRPDGRPCASALDSPLHGLCPGPQGWRPLGGPDNGSVLGESVTDSDERGAIGFAEKILELLARGATPRHTSTGSRGRDIRTTASTTLWSPTCAATARRATRWRRIRIWLGGHSDLSRIQRIPSFGDLTISSRWGAWPIESLTLRVTSTQGSRKTPCCGYAVGHSSHRPGLPLQLRWISALGPALLDDRRNRRDRAKEPVAGDASEGAEASQHDSVRRTRSVDETV